MVQLPRKRAEGSIENRHLTSLRRVFSRGVKARESMLVILLIVLITLFGSTIGGFVSVYNIRSSLMAMVTTTFVAIGQTAVLITGGFDLSVGSILAFCGIMTGKALNGGVPVVPAILIGLFIGAGLGYLNGLLVTKVRMNPFIATLGTMTVVRGASLALTEGRVVGGLPKAFNFIGQGQIAGIPVAVLMMFFLVIIGELLLRRHRWFRQIFYIGSNEEAARFSPIRVDRVKCFAYMISGFFAALAGIVSASRMGSMMATAGSGVELTSIAAAVIGGVTLGGGAGSIFGSVLGVMLLVMITNVLLLLGVSPYWQKVFSGALLLAVVAIDVFSTRRKNV